MHTGICIYYSLVYINLYVCIYNIIHVHVHDVEYDMIVSIVLWYMLCKMGSNLCYIIMYMYNTVID